MTAKAASSKSKGAAGVTSLALAISILLAVGPIAVVILAAFSSAGSFVFPPPGFTLQWLIQFFDTPSLTAALILSFEIAFVAATISSCLAFIAAIALARMRSQPAAALIEAAFLAPLVFPSIILGVALLIFYRAVGLNLTAGLVIAHVTVALPYAFRLIYSEIQVFDFTLNEAAASLGAGPAGCAYYVMLPIIWPGLLSGWMFGFVVSLGELNTSLFLTGPGFTTLPIEMFSYLQFEGAQLVIAAASAIQIVAVLGLFSLIEILRRFSAARTRM